MILTNASEGFVLYNLVKVLCFYLPKIKIYAKQCETTDGRQMQLVVLQLITTKLY